MARVAHDGEPDGETQAVFGVEGERILTEATLDHMEGFAGSQPVRIGNAAWEQRQLDVYGHIMAAAGSYDSAADFDPVVQRFLCQVATRAARGWHRPDHGIWERRGEPRHHTSSKLACWVALGQALAFSDALGEDRDPLEWAAQRDAARDWLESAWDETRQAFPAWPGSDDVDASMLLFVVNGFLAPDDPRGRQAVETVESELGRNGLLVRWSGSEDGAFLLCSCWLVQALVELGELDRAEEALERVVTCANDVGLLPEEIDTTTGGALGNVPLAISHAGLVAAATAIQTARDAGRTAKEGVAR
jgi:GH15 family glucan-1,4-alpha-glucosidase